MGHRARGVRARHGLQAIRHADRSYLRTVTLGRPDADAPRLYTQCRVVPLQTARVDATGGGKAKYGAPRLPGYVALSRR